ncbi:hypothetical protein C3K47_17365 [Solitalea longa]|uniref:NIPSNAP domain-containing protein n=1 Tax=Solitalea longa TaxID=2079460 RepID=A0A2S4ZXL7_9SPHI|nr:hypothetical protein [Solitalea longa]POY35026.1 hypothetical protein C3K47_17365 [Solitalea longa]
MKSIKTYVLMIGLICIAYTANSQSMKPYTESSVWDITMIRVKPGMGEDYLKSLNGGLRKLYDEAIKQGLLVSYKILSGDASGQGDWNMLILVEYKNMAALDGLSDKMDAMEQKVVGNEDVQKKIMVSRVDMRDIIGTKLMRELKFQ